MTKIVLKKSEVVKSPRPIVIQPLGNNLANSNLQSYGDKNSDNIFDLLDNDKQTPAQDNPAESQVDEVLPAQEQAQQILENARKEAELIISRAEEDKDSAMLAIQKEKQEIIDNAQKEAEDIRNTATSEVNETRSAAHQEAFEKSYEDAQAEKKRLVNLLQKITVDLVEEKDNILKTIESDVVDLILMISNKVVKTITSQYKQVVYDNVVACLQKIKVHNNILIKVNPEDLPTMESHKSNLLSEINGIENLQILEDPSIELGGCVIQSDFGSMDGRISSQLAEIEEQIRKISPIPPLP